MARLKVPSLQHLARNWHGDPLVVKKSLVDLVKNAPRLSYDPLFGAVRDMLVFGQPYEQIIEGIRRGVRRQKTLEILLPVLPLIKKHFEGIRPDFVQSVGRRYYPVGRGLMVPFEPPLIYGIGGQIHFPWFVFWKTNPLRAKKLSLFVSIVEEVLHQDPDLENSRFVILDFSSPGPKMPRELKITDAREIPHLTQRTKTEMLETFVEGYLLAQAELAGEMKPAGDDDRKSEVITGLLPGLFD